MIDRLVVVKDYRRSLVSEFLSFSSKVSLEMKDCRFLSRSGFTFMLNLDRRAARFILFAY